MPGMREDGIFLRWNAYSGQGRRELSKARHLYTAHIVECTVAVGVASDAVCDVPDLSGYMSELRQEFIPLRRNAGARFAGIAAGQSGHQKGVGVLEADGERMIGHNFLQPDGLHQG